MKGKVSLFKNYGVRVAAIGLTLVSIIFLFDKSTIIDGCVDKSTKMGFLFSLVKGCNKIFFTTLLALLTL